MTTNPISTRRATMANTEEDHNGIPSGAFTAVIREDPNKRRAALTTALKRACTFLSMMGAKMASLQLNLSRRADPGFGSSQTRERMVAATQGRSFWIFDDSAGAAPNDGCRWIQSVGDTHLFKPRDAYRIARAAVLLFRRCDDRRNPAVASWSTISESETSPMR